MALSKDRLTELRADAECERQKYLDMVQQANGAIAMLDFLLAECGKEAPSDQGQG
jgi:hypothetical protein